MTVESYPRQARETVGPGMLSRRVYGSSSGAWTQPVITEWELTGAQWTDEHPYDEFNYVLEGELHVESEGVVAIAHAGDLVRVTAHSAGRYFAPGHARMLAIYDHNPAGAPTTVMGLEPAPDGHSAE